MEKVYEYLKVIFQEQLRQKSLLLMGSQFILMTKRVKYQMHMLDLPTNYLEERGTNYGY